MSFDHRPNGWFFEARSVEVRRDPWIASVSFVDGGPFPTVREAVAARYERVR